MLILKLMLGVDSWAPHVVHGTENSEYGNDFWAVNTVAGFLISLANIINFSRRVLYSSAN
jgi:hypothetical protein